MKVCLIGNNLTGLILANVLSKKNFHIDVFSSKSSKLKFKTRSLGITESNLIYLNKYFKKILSIINPINEIKIFIKNKRINNEILLNKKSKTLFGVTKYEELFSYIRSRSISKKNVSFKNIKKDSDLIKMLNLKTYNLIINCEKENILTQKFLKKKITKEYFNKAFTTIISHKKIKNNSAAQIFTERGPIAFLPINKKKNICSFFIRI